AGTDLISENLIQRHVQTRLARAFVNQLPVEIVPGCAAHDTSSSARATAAATACGEMPYMATSSPSAASSVDVMDISSLSVGRRVSARLIVSSAASGSRKKSPLI